jgi:hypothetical protein
MRKPAEPARAGKCERILFGTAPRANSGFLAVIGPGARQLLRGSVHLLACAALPNMFW